MFNEHRDVIAELKQQDAHFHKIFDRHNDLDVEIGEMEKSLVDQFEIEKRKKEKLKLKDEVYSYILKHKNDS